MASIRAAFLSGVETIFNTFVDAVKTGSYTLITDDGFDDLEEGDTVVDTIRCIFETFTAKDVDSLSFSALIQPMDIKGLMPYVDLVNNKDKMETKGFCTFSGERYEVVAFDLDPMSVIYTLLLRKN